VRDGLTRRAALALLPGAVVAARAGPALADEAAAIIAEFTGGEAPEPGRVRLTLPGFAEDGASVPVTIAVDGPFAQGERVTAILVAEANPTPLVARFTFPGLSGAATVTTRIRLARSQTVTAVARMADGAAHAARAHVEVAVGGCG